MSNDDEELEERVNELENTIERMLPGRRQMLKAAGAGVLGASAFTAGQASADGHNDGDTQWGSDTNRSDYFADYVNSRRLESIHVHNGSLPDAVVFKSSGTVYADGHDGTIASVPSWPSA